MCSGAIAVGAVVGSKRAVRQTKTRFSKHRGESRFIYSSLSSTVKNEQLVMRQMDIVAQRQNTDQPDTSSATEQTSGHSRQSLSIISVILHNVILIRFPSYTQARAPAVPINPIRQRSRCGR